MADPIKIVSIHAPKITIRNGHDLIDDIEWGNGSKEILLDDSVVVTVHYQYPYTDNLSVRNLAERIAAMLRGSPEVPRG